METNVFEKIIAILIFPLSFLYASWLFESNPDHNRIMFGIFTLLVIIIVEAIYWKRKRNFETYAMLLMTVLGGVSVCFDIGEAWEYYMKIFFTHLFAVYYILVRSGRPFDPCRLYGKRRHREPRTALTDEGDGLSLIRAIIALYPDCLKPGGVLLIEHGWRQAEAVRDMAEHAGLTYAPIRDYGGNTRAAEMRKKT